MPAPRPDAADSLAHVLARDLLRIGAVTLRPEVPFTWASGLRAPLYTDNRLTLSDVAARTRIADALAALVAPLGADVVAGTATAGIPHAALVADRLALPMAYVRSAPKGHGRGNRIEGRVAAGQRLVVVEDLVSTGQSSLDAVQALRDAGAEVVAVVAVFTYGLDAASGAFAAAGVPLRTLVSYADVVAAADLPEASAAVLRAWRTDPQAWSDAHAG